MKNIDKNIINPPKNCEFYQLFGSFRDQGVGNTQELTGAPKPWKTVDLETALNVVGYKINSRSIQDWYSGKRVPQISALRALAIIASGREGDYKGDEGVRQKWSDAFIFARRDFLYKQKKGKRDALKVGNASEKRENSVNPLDLIAQSHVEGRKTGRAFLSSQIWGILSTTITASLLLVIFFLVRKPSIQVTNIKFCDAQRFSEEFKLCKVGVTHFSDDIKFIYVSFELTGAPEGHPFERHWYRHGRKFLSKEGFYDSAWENYTWVSFPETFEAGKYDLRVIVDKKVATGTFYVGDHLSARSLPDEH